MASSLLCVVGTFALLRGADSHGFLAHPVARNVRDSSFPQRPTGTTNTPQGLGHNNANLNAVHGLCGDGPSGPQYWATPGIVQQTYLEGAVVEFDVRITAHHLGFFEFELCDSPNISEECFKQNQLLRAGCSGDATRCRVSWKPAMESELSSATLSSGLSYPTGAPVISGTHLGGVNFKMQYKLPEGVTCDHCVIRWHYFTTNSCTSPGSGAEEFWNCADVAIQATEGGETKHTAVDGTALATLVNTLLTQQPQSTADRGNFRCSTFGEQLNGNPSWGYINVADNAAEYLSTMYGESMMPGYTTACMPNMGATEGCLFQGERELSYWNSDGPATESPTQALATAQTTGPSSVVTHSPASIFSTVACVGKFSGIFDSCCAELALVNPACDMYPQTCELRPIMATSTEEYVVQTTNVPDTAAAMDTMACVGKYTPTLDVWCANVGVVDPECDDYPDHCELRSVLDRRLRRQNIGDNGKATQRGARTFRGRVL